MLQCQQINANFPFLKWKLCISSLFSQATELRDRPTLKWWIVNRNRKRGNYKTCSIIILAIKLCEEQNVCASLADVGENEGPMARHWSALLVRLWRDYANIYLSFHTTPEYGKSLTKSVHIRENLSIPRRQMEQTSASVICQQRYNLKWLERGVRKGPVPPP